MRNVFLFTIPKFSKILPILSYQKMDEYYSGHIWMNPNKLSPEFTRSSGGNKSMVDAFNEYYTDCDWWKAMKKRFTEKTGYQRKLDCAELKIVRDAYESWSKSP